jgi:hypothetical protein
MIRQATISNCLHLLGHTLLATAAGHSSIFSVLDYQKVENSDEEFHRAYLYPW